MAKEDKPLEYQRRIRDTKGVAQRLDLGYLKRSAPLLLLRKRLTWVFVALAVLSGVPLVLGVGGSRRAVSNGPLSEAHSMFEKRCEVCHTQAFDGVPDQACQQCHDGAAHPAKLVDTARMNSVGRCAACHQEHRGQPQLAAVGMGNCTSCHADLAAHASGVTLKGTEITAFRLGRHPEFSSASAKDTRPLRLNHAIHMPVGAKVIRGIPLPMKCGDCHATDRASATGALLPVTFEHNCKACHARELEFDVYHLLSAAGAPAPHTPAPHAKDPKTIRDFLVTAYRGALAANPAVARRPLGNELAPQANAAVWLERVVKDSEAYLFGRKCVYCHEIAALSLKTAGDQGRPEFKKVNRVAGRYVETKPDGEPWFARGEFSHRRHRAVECESCHTTARASSRTSDVLTPVMQACTPCHGGSGTTLDRCSECHLYHNRNLQKDRERRPAGQMAGGAL
jgi:hypothetical protein